MEKKNSTGYRIRGFVDNHPIYDKKGNFSTVVEFGDTLIASFTGFGSECLEYGKRYVVIYDNGEAKLKGEDGEVLDYWHTKNTMPFFLKLRP